MEALVVARGWWVCRALAAGGSTPRARTCSTRRPACPRRLGPGAAPLSVRSLCGTPWAATPLSNTAIAASLVSPGATREATARRQWSSCSWKMTALRPPARTYSVASSCQRALGAGWTNRRQAERGRLRGSLRATPLRRKDPRRGRGRGGLQPHRAHLVVHRDGAVAPAPRTPARFAPPEPAGPSPGRSGSGWMPGGSSAARGPPPVLRTWPGPVSRRTSCGRCPARRRRRSPRPWGRRRATARSPGGHGDQHEDSVHSPRNPSGSVTAPSPRTVTDVLRHHKPRASGDDPHMHVNDGPTAA